MQLTSLSGEVFRVMIGGYHTNDDNLIYGSQTIFDDLSPFTDGLDLLPVSIQMSSCSFYGDPSMIVLNSNETGIELQPFNTKIAHYVLIADDIEYPINIQTASYLIPTFTITTLKLVSLHRVAISFSNVTSNIGDITYANTQFPTVTPSNTCSFVPESVLYESGTTLEHIDEYFQWQLYRVTPSTRLKQIEVVDDVFSFSFSTEEIELVMGYPVYLQFTRYFDVLEFHFTSDCSVDFVSADMFTLSDTTKYESGKTVKCSNVESSFTTKEYRNDLGNVVLYGNLLKLNIDLSCSAYVNYVSFSLQGIIGATITVDKLFFNTVDTYSNITKCYPESVYCNSYCTPNTNESCTAFCGKCGSWNGMY
ncbi:Transmembrane protein [Entamoeba marina]